MSNPRDKINGIIKDALDTGDVHQANERLFQLSGGKTTRQAADEWAQLLREPENEAPR
jgi:hypothetical protein